MAEHKIGTIHIRVLEDAIDGRFEPIDVLDMEFVPAGAKPGDPHLLVRLAAPRIVSDLMMREAVVLTGLQNLGENLRGKLA